MTIKPKYLTEENSIATTEKMTAKNFELLVFVEQGWEHDWQGEQGDE